MTNLKERQEFEKLRNKWKTILSDTEDHPHNTVVNQLLYITDRYRYWQVLVNESRSFRFDEDGKQTLKCSQFLDHFIDIGLIYSQAVGISALAFNTDKHDASLRNVLNDIEANRNKITRENFVLYDSDLGYQDSYKEEIIDAEGSEGEIVYGVNKQAVFERRHEYFDTLSGTTVEERNKSDTISDDYFNTLEEKLNSCEKEKDYLSVLSHRKIYIDTEPDEKFQVTYFDLEDCHKALWYVFHSIFLYFTDEWYGTVSTYRGDLFEGLSDSWISENDLELLRDIGRSLEITNATDFSHYYGRNNDQ